MRWSSFGMSEAPGPTVLSFEDFELDLAAVELRRGGAAVALEPQVFNLLAYLSSHKDRLVSKEELLDELWGHRFVSESALSTQIKAARKALNDSGREQRVIKTVHGRGYRFVAPVSVVRSGTNTSPNEPGEARLPEPVAGNLGRDRTPLFGREHDVEAVCAALEGNQLVTLLGIGGTGKTRLAKAVGRRLQARFPDGVWFVDLVPLRTAGDLDTNLGAMLGLSMDSTDTRRQIAAAIAARRTLFIFDNCEHIEPVVAAAVDFFLEYCPEPKFLATSRDPLDLPDEHRYFVPPLSTAGSMSPACELFVTTAQRHGVETEFATPSVTAICDQLDGLPLSIELAAAQLRHLTLDELGARLGQRFELLARGSGVRRERAAEDRQGSLVAVIADTWSLLAEEEQALLGQLTAFRGPFTMQDVEDLLGNERPANIGVMMSRLVELCLLSRTSGQGAWWRLLQTVREYAVQLQDPEDGQRLARMHGEWVLDRLGDYPHDHQDHFEQARWSADHYAEIEAAEAFYAERGDTARAVEICTATGLMIQLDEGARARAKLERVNHYLEAVDDVYLRAQLHASAALAAQVVRAPKRLAEHAEESLRLSRELGDPLRISGALVLASLHTAFVDPERARANIAEAVQIAEDVNNQTIIDSARVFGAWQSATQRDYEDAVAAAEAIAERNITEGVWVNATYNAVCIMIACNLFTAPATALGWAQRLREYHEGESLWGAQILMAAASALNGDVSAAAAKSVVVRDRLLRSGHEGLPDLLVPAAVCAYAAGETARAQRWCNAVRALGRPLQSFHVTVIYRQLQDAVGKIDDPLDGMSLERFVDDLGDWVESQL